MLAFRMAAAAGHRPRPLRLLVVEDNPDDVELIRLKLGAVDTDRQFVIEAVDRLSTALRRLKGSDVVLLDLGLPDSGGLDAVARLSNEAPEMPLVVLTGREDAALGLARGARGGAGLPGQGQGGRCPPRPLAALRHGAQARGAGAGPAGHDHGRDLLRLRAQALLRPPHQGVRELRGQAASERFARASGGGSPKGAGAERPLRRQNRHREALEQAGHGHRAPAHGSPVRRFSQSPSGSVTVVDCQFRRGAARSAARRWPRGRRARTPTTCSPRGPRPRAARTRPRGRTPPGSAAAACERVPDDPQLRQRPRRRRQDRLRRRPSCELREQSPPRVVVDRPAVVGIDQAQVPQLGALVDVGHAGRGQLEQRLRQRR